MKLNFKKYFLYFFQKDLKLEEAYTKLLRFSALQIFLAVAYTSSVVGYGLSVGWGGGDYVGFASCFLTLMVLVAVINWKITKNYQNCCTEQQYKRSKLLFLERILSFSTLPFCLFMKPIFFFRNNYTSKKEQEERASQIKE